MWLAKLLKDYVVGTLKKVANTERGEEKKKSVPGCILIVPWENLSVLWPYKLEEKENTLE